MSDEGWLFGAPTWLDAILSALAERIRAGARLGDGLVLWTTAPDDAWGQFPERGQFVTLRPGRFQSDAQYAAGGGIGESVYSGAIEVGVWQSLGDERDRSARRELSGDHAALWRRVVGLCHQWQGGGLLLEPATVPAFGAGARPAKPNSPWSPLSVEVRVSFRADLATEVEPAEVKI